MGLDRTIAVLRATDNRARAGLLAELCLHGPEPIAQEALELILKEDLRDALCRLVPQYDQLPAERQARLRTGGSSLSFAIRQAYLDSDPRAYQNACLLIESIPAYELISLILGSLEHDTDRREDSIRLLSALATKLGKQLSLSPIDRQIPDVDVVRRQFLASLEFPFKRFAHHKVRAVPEAMLIVADENDEIVRNALTDQTHSCHRAMIDAIATRKEDRFLRWVFAALEWRPVPPAILTLIGRRRDEWFLRKLLARASLLARPAVAAAFQKIKEIEGLRPGVFPLDQLSEEEQVAAIVLGTVSGMPLTEKTSLAARMLDEGTGRARVAAACALALLPGNEVNQLVIACLADEDPSVQLAALRQVRLRNLPSSLTLLMDKLNHSDDRLRRAAREGLADDFNFERFARGFDQLDEKTRSVVGTTIARIDEQTDDKIRDLLGSAHRNHRLRALRIVLALDRSDPFWKQIAEMLSDTDHVLRASAIDALTTVTDTRAIEFLEAAVDGGSPQLMKGATEALRELAESARSPEIRERAARHAVRTSSP